MELNSVKIQQNYKKILEDIKKYSPYPEKVKILFVSKYLNVEEHKTLIEMGYDYFGDVRTVDVTVRRLREKIEDTPGRPEYILTRRGVGYYMRNND